MQQCGPAAGKLEKGDHPFSCFVLKTSGQYSLYLMGTSVDVLSSLEIGVLMCRYIYFCVCVSIYSGASPEVSRMGRAMIEIETSKITWPSRSMIEISEMHRKSDGNLAPLGRETYTYCTCDSI